MSKHEGPLYSPEPPPPGDELGGTGRNEQKERVRQIMVAKTLEIEDEAVNNLVTLKSCKKGPASQNTVVVEGGPK